MEFIYCSGRGCKCLFIVCPRLGFRDFAVTRRGSPFQIPDSQRSVCFDALAMH